MHLLVTNDYPPKVGGIQSYLWELWRRMDTNRFAVVTTPHSDSHKFDQSQNYPIRRYDRFWLTATGHAKKFITEAIRDYGAKALVIDPAFPLAALGPGLGLKYAVMIHGAEAVIPAKIPGPSWALRRAISNAEMVITSSRYALKEVEEKVPTIAQSKYIPPGVDVSRFQVQNPEQRAATRKKLGLDPDAKLIVSVSRLVRRKGFDTLIRCAKVLQQRHRNLQVVIGGTGRDDRRLRTLAAQLQAPVKFIGFVPDAELSELYGCADVSTMLCRDQWFGLEQEGFGIVFLEAQAAGSPVVAGRSGGSSEAVRDGYGGYVVDPTDVGSVVEKLDLLLSEPELNEIMRRQARLNAEKFSYDLLVKELAAVIETLY